MKVNNSLPPIKHLGPQSYPSPCSISTKHPTVKIGLNMNYKGNVKLGEIVGEGYLEKYSPTEVSRSRGNTPHKMDPFSKLSNSDKVRVVDNIHPKIQNKQELKKYRDKIYARVRSARGKNSIDENTNFTSAITKNLRNNSPYQRRLDPIPENNNILTEESTPMGNQLFSGRSKSIIEHNIGPFQGSPVVFNSPQPQQRSFLPTIQKPIDIGDVEGLNDRIETTMPSTRIISALHSPRVTRGKNNTDLRLCHKYKLLSEYEQQSQVPYSNPQSPARQKTIPELKAPSLGNYRAGQHKLSPSKPLVSQRQGFLNELYAKKPIVKTERSMSLGSEGRSSNQNLLGDRVGESQSMMKAMDRKMVRNIFANSPSNEVSRNNYTLDQAEEIYNIIKISPYKKEKFSLHQKVAGKPRYQKAVE